MPCEDSVRRWLSSERELSPEPDHAISLALDFQVQDQWENIFLLFKLHSLYGIVFWQSEQTKIVIINYPFYMFAKIVLRNFTSMFMSDISL